MYETAPLPAQPLAGLLADLRAQADHQAARFGPLAALHALILSTLVRLFTGLEQFFEQWRAGILPHPTPRPIPHRAKQAADVTPPPEAANVAPPPEAAIVTPPPEAAIVTPPPEAAIVPPPPMAAIPSRPRGFIRHAQRASSGDRVAVTTKPRSHRRPHVRRCCAAPGSPTLQYSPAAVRPNWVFRNFFASYTPPSPHDHIITI